MLEDYAAARAELIAQITRALSADARFVAAWLAGSFGRGQADVVSDLDLVVVVDDPFSAALCARPWMTRGGTTDERLALIRQFGEPATIHENNHNAPPDGTFTFVLYAGSALMVDWVLIPRAVARRPGQTLLLFDRAGIPPLAPAAPGSAGERAGAVAERIAFFWMMAAVTAKYVVRRDTITVLGLLEMIHHTVIETEHLLAREPIRYRRGALGTLVLTPEEQVEVIHGLAGRVEGLAERLAAEGEEVPRSSRAEIELLLKQGEKLANVP